MSSADKRIATDATLQQVVAALQALEPGLVTTTQAGKLAPDAEAIANGFIKLATSSNKGLMSKAFAALLENPDRITFYANSVTNNAGFHNSIYRGKSLGSSLTAAQSAQIQAGTFEDMFIGDYWTINGVKYVIADFDPYYRCGDNISLGHHVAVIPESYMASAAWNIDTNDTSKMYVGSDIRIVTIQGQESGSTPNADSTSGVQGTIISAFGSSHVLKYRALYPSSQSSGSATGWAWVDARVELLNEVEVYGTQAWTDNGKGNGYEIGINKRQLSIFRLRPDFCNIRATGWLRSVHSATGAAFVNSAGDAGIGSASHSIGVRPLSLIA